MAGLEEAIVIFHEGRTWQVTGPQCSDVHTIIGIIKMTQMSHSRGLVKDDLFQASYGL